MLSTNRNLLRTLPLLLIFIAAVVSMRTVLTESGFVFKDDMAFPLTDQQVREALLNRFSVWYGKIGGGFDPALPSSIPFWAFYNLLGLVLKTELVGKLFIVMIFTLAGYSMYLFSRRLFSFPPSLSAAFLYMLNPWTFDRIASGHLNLLMGYALAPVSLMFIFKLREKADFKDYVFTALSLALMLSFTVHFFALVLIVVAFYVVFTAVFSRGFWGKKRIASLLLVFASALLLNFFWLLPTLSHYSFVKTSLIEPAVGASIIETINRQAGILNTLRLTGYWLPYFRGAIDGLGSLSIIWHAFSFLIPALSFATVCVNKSKIMVFFSVVAITCLVPSMIASNYPYFYQQLIDYFQPLALFRDSYKFIALACFSYCILIAGLLEKLISISSKLKKSTEHLAKSRSFHSAIRIFLTYCAISLVIFSMLIYAMPNIVSGDFMGQLDARPPPSYWFDVKGFLDEQNESCMRVLWVPPLPELHYEWHDGNSVDPVDEYLSDLYAVSLKSRNLLLNNYAEFLTASMYEETSSIHLGKLLTPLSVKYVVARLDTEPAWKDGRYPPQRLYETLEHQLDLRKIFESGKWIVYEEKYANPYATTQPLNGVLILGNLSAVTSLCYLSEGRLPLLLFMDLERLSAYDVDQLMSLSNEVANTSILTLAIPVDQPLVGIDLLDQIEGQKKWVYLLEGEKLFYDEKSNVPNHSFEEGLAQWNPGNAAFSLKPSEDAVEGRQSLEVTTSSNASYCWSWVSSDDIPVIPEVTYKFSTNIKLFNVMQSHVKIVGFSSLTEKWEEICWLPWGLDGTLNWTHHEFLWTSSKNYTKIKVILNAGWVKDPSAGNATTLFDDISITPQVSVNASFSNTKALPLREMARTEIRTLAASTYRIGIRTFSTEENEVKVELRSNDVSQTVSIQVEPDSLDLFYSPVVCLPSSNYTVEISSGKPLILDAFALFSVNEENETLQEYFTAQEPQAEVTNLKRNHATSYTIEVNATTCFLLSISEAYDPSWTAYVNGQRIKPTPIYSVINGFWINQTGQLRITIEYEPQKTFYYGSVISVSTLIAYVAYVIYYLNKQNKHGTFWKRHTSHIA